MKAINGKAIFTDHGGGRISARFNPPDATAVHVSRWFIDNYVGTHNGRAVFRGRAEAAEKRVTELEARIAAVLALCEDTEWFTGYPDDDLAVIRRAAGGDA